MNLLIELYDYPYIENFYYIQNNEIKEFSDEIVKKLREISIDDLIYYSFMEECDYAEAKEEKNKTISKIADCIKTAGYSVEKIFLMIDGSSDNSFTVESEEE